MVVAEQAIGCFPIGRVLVSSPRTTSLNREQTAPQGWWFPPAVVALAYFALHLLTATRYAYFRDALYYLACGEHLEWGYVDPPPLIAGLAWVARHTLGTSLRALLVWPATGRRRADRADGGVRARARGAELRHGAGCAAGRDARRLVCDRSPVCDECV
jgi:hypothetical protein